MESVVVWTGRGKDNLYALLLVVVTVREIVVRTNGEACQAGADRGGELMRKLKDTAERSLYVFAKAVLGWKLLTTDLHQPLCLHIQTTPPRRKGYLLPRGHFKTTLAKSLVMHMTIQPPDHNLYLPGVSGTEMRIIYCCKTTDRAETRIRAIKETYERNSLLRAFWPEVVWDDPSQAKTKWNQERLLLRRQGIYDEATIERTGVNASITGGHFDAMIKDDLIDIADRNEPTTMQNAIDWNHSSTSLANDISKLLEWYFGTHWGAFDLYNDVEKVEPYDPKTQTGVLWYKRSVVENGKPIFPERFPMAEIQRLREKDEDLFYLNYMNTIVGSKLQDFNMAAVREFQLQEDTVEFEEHEVDQDLAHLFEGDSFEPGTRLMDTFQRRLRGSTIYKIT